MKTSNMLFVAILPLVFACNKNSKSDSKNAYGENDALLEEEYYEANMEPLETDVPASVVFKKIPVYGPKGEALGRTSVVLPSGNIKDVNLAEVEIGDKMVKFIPAKDISTNPITGERTGQTNYYVNSLEKPTMVVSIDYNLITGAVENIGIHDYRKK